VDRPDAPPLTAASFLDALHAAADDAERVKIRRLVTRDDPDNVVLGVRMRTLFDLAKAAAGMPLAEVEVLLESPFHEGRLGAWSILDAKARRADADRAALAELYLRRHDRITSWDMVDRAAPHVLGRYLAGGPPDLLHELAGSSDPLRRRSAITAPLWFVRYGSPGDLAATFALAAVLAADGEEPVARAVGIALKHAGARDESALLAFLDAHAPRLSRTALREATAKLDPAVRSRYRP
jgi:3-methyladenine DNA glycosylase AlkD